MISNADLDEFNRFANIAGYEVNLQFLAREVLTCIMGLALLVIGCMGVAGSFSNPALGWTALGLSAGMCGLALSHGNFNKRKIELIGMALMYAIFIILGCMGGTGLLTTKQAGMGILITSLVGGCCYAPCVFGGSVYTNLPQVEPPNLDDPL